MANEEIEKMLDNSSEVLDALHAEFLKSIKASLAKTQVRNACKNQLNFKL